MVDYLPLLFIVNHMVEYSKALDKTFGALADPTRRQIISMLIEQRQRRINDLAAPFAMSLAAVSKHIKVLEQAGLVQRYKRGRESYLELNPQQLQEAQQWLDFHARFWAERFAHLQEVLDDQATEED